MAGPHTSMAVNGRTWATGRNQTLSSTPHPVRVFQQAAKEGQVGSSARRSRRTARPLDWRSRAQEPVDAGGGVAVGLGEVGHGSVGPAGRARACAARPSAAERIRRDSCAVRGLPPVSISRPRATRRVALAALLIQDAQACCETAAGGQILAQPSGLPGGTHHVPGLVQPVEHRAVRQSTGCDEFLDRGTDRSGTAIEFVPGATLNRPS